PRPAPRSPYFLTPSSSCSAARSGCCSATDANATKRSGFAAHASASFSFWIWMSWRGAARAALYPSGVVIAGATGVRRPPPPDLLVLDLDELAGDVAVGLVPVGIDAEGLDVDALLVHGADPVRGLRHQKRLRLGLPLYEGPPLGHGAVRVHVDGLHAPPVHHHLAPARLRLRLDSAGAARQGARHEREAGHG